MADKSLVSKHAQKVIRNADHSGQSEYAYVAEFLSDIIHNWEYSGDPPSNLYGTIDDYLISSLRYFIECAQGVLEDLKLIWTHTANLESDELDLYLQLRIYHDPEEDTIWFDIKQSRVGSSQAELYESLPVASIQDLDWNLPMPEAADVFARLRFEVNRIVRKWEKITGLAAGNKSLVPNDLILADIVREARQPAEE